MRILLVSDLHYKLRQYDWLIRAASGFDCVVVAGDQADIASAVPAEVQIAALSASLQVVAQKAPLLVCSGNHDLNTRNIAGEKTADWLAPLRGPRLAVDGDTVWVGQALFTVCPWWDGPHGQQEVQAQMAAAAQQREPGRPWIWVYHAPPQGPLSWTGRRHFGDPLLPELVRQYRPDAVLCGHIHEAPFKPGGGWVDRMADTWLFNAGRQIGDTPTRIELDIEGSALARARWISMEGMETRDLAGPQPDAPAQ